MVDYEHYAKEILAQTTVAPIHAGGEENAAMAEIIIRSMADDPQAVMILARLLKTIHVRMIDELLAGTTPIQ